jgi:hypothetical protein
MPYQRHRSYRRAARLYRHQDRPVARPLARPARPARPRFALAAGFLAVALAVVLAITLGPRAKTALTASDTGTGGVAGAASGAGSPRAANTNCDLIVPADPLSAAGLATPYRITGPHTHKPHVFGCNQANAANLGAFVQATILDPATGALSVYEPLVITQGTKPAIAPVPPRLPPGAIVTIDIGFNGTNLRQVGAGPHALQEGHCVNGLPGSLFGQVSFCNGPAFFQAAFQDEARGKLVVPAAGFSPRTRQACPTTRSFKLVDQDPSDNVTTRYLLTSSRQTAQYNRHNAAALPGATVISNGSDNALLDDFVDPALGCRPFEVPDLSQGGAPGTSQALDELSAAANQAAPRALVPENDEMVLVKGAFSVAKTNLYRASVGQPAISPANDQADSPASYCRNIMAIQTQFLLTSQPELQQEASPVPADGNNLFTFMAGRLVTSYGILGCRRFDVQDPWRVTRNSAGVAVAAGE